MKPAIQLNQVSKSFKYWDGRPVSLKTLLVDTLRGKFRMGSRRRIDVLQDLSFEIQPGEFVGIMGRNGAGKSTTLKLICGIYTPTSGSVEVNGAIAPLIELGAGFHPDLSGYENIFLNAAVLGFGRRATFESLPKIIEFSELGDMIHMPVKHYSSGMLVRLGFSIATHLDAPILLIDEVLAVGDAGFQTKCIDKIKKLHHQGRTVVLVTHSPESVRLHCDRCIVIANHGTIYDGPAAKGSEVYLDTVQAPTAT